MAATIKIKNSSTASAVPTSSDLVQGELAVNVTDRRLFTENASGTVVELGTNPSILTLPDGSASAPTLTNDGDTNTGIFFPAADTVGITTGGTERLRVDSSGNLGLGVTPSAWGGTGVRAFQISGYGSFAGSVGSVDVYNNAYYDGSAFKYISSNPATRYSQNTSGASHAWYTAGSGTAGNTISFTQAMTLDASGNLGVGTTSPNVAGGTRAVTLDAPTAGNYSGFELMTGGVLRAKFIGNSSQTYFGTETGTPLILVTGGTERARIDTSGNLLVGKTSADTTSSGLTLIKQGAGYGQVVCVKTVSGSGYNAWANYYNGTYIGGIDFSNTATSFPTSSDIRLKKDIVDAGSASAKIDQIRIVAHGWKHDENDTVEFGVIAQELNLIAPQAVVAGDDGEEIEKTWAVDYSKLVPMLIKAHQEQQAIITQLQADVAALKGQA